MNILYLLMLIEIVTSSHESKNATFSHDYYEGIGLSKELDKPIYLLFTGHTCEHNEIVNDLIENDERIIEKLVNDFVPVILFVDDKTKLEKEKKVIQKGKTVTLRTKGNVWAHIEISKYNSNMQPMMLIVDSEERMLKEPLVGKVSSKELMSYLSQ